jgi:predicted nucleic acid-binding protein
MLCPHTFTIAHPYVPAPESPVVRRRLEAEDEVCVSELARLELMGVFHRRLREGKWTRDDFLASVRQFSTDDISGFWTWLPLDSAIIDAAANTYTTLPGNVFLRSADCLHLVTALHYNFDTVHTHDKHQTLASSALGLAAVAIQP